MLTQSFRREITGTDAFASRTMLREKDFSVAIIRAHAIALDRGVLGPTVKFARRFRRRQISIVLSGHGYVDVAGRIVVLEEGDVLASDQRLHRGEGYAGTPSDVIILDWEDGGLFDTSLRCDGSVAKLAPADRAMLLAHVQRIDEAPALEAWLEELMRRLAAIGIFARALPDARALPSSPQPLLRLYRALGTVLSTLEKQPSLGELARMAGMSERQSKRLLAELTKSYGHSFTSWRDFLHEMRLDWTGQLLSLPNLTIERVSKLAGYRSDEALHHALSLRGGETPGTIAKRLKERWR